MDLKGGTLFVENPALDRALRLGIPLLMYPLYVLALVLAFPDLAPVYLALVAAYIVPPVGGEALIPVAAALGYPWWLTAASFAWVDVAGCLLVALNADLLFALPYVGPALSRTAGVAGAFFEHHPALRRLSYPGLVLFTVLPFAGSGGVGGALAGRVLGMGRRAVVVCVSAGSIVGSALLAFGAGAAASLLREYCAAGTVVVALVLAGASVLVLCRVALLHMGGPPISRDR
ncbi:MAG: small multi-drug export protein [Methanofollis sp.]|uniref:small multi-drug export protein n=1 Tax=Methanofollis sp. TaxID=2052835 RepID=UPI0026267019|nr:small multi-drug export protein [Methanofollis sp.]MDD4254444.1 small multi-drug export protein [Methanofollis sp.]